MTQDHVGRSVSGSICGPGDYTHLVEVRCPWCCVQREMTVCAFREVFGGYAGPDFICGTCGYEWSADSDKPMRAMKEEQREANIAKVAAMKKAGTVTGPIPVPKP